MHKSPVPTATRTLLVLLALGLLLPSIPLLHYNPQAWATGSTTLGIWSESPRGRAIVDTSLVAGQQLTLEVNVTNVHVIRFTGFDITVRYNSTLLNATSTTLTGGLFDPATRQEYCTPPTIDNSQGSLRRACVLLGATMSDVDTGSLFFIQFKILAQGSSLVDVDESVSSLTDNVLYTPLDGFFSNQSGIHEVGVLSVTTTAVSELAVPGDMITVHVTIVNLGGQDEQATVEASANSTLLGNAQTIGIPSLGRITLDFPWNTTGFAPAVYRISATATASQDAFPGDNSLNVELVRLAIRDLAIGNVRVPTNTVFVNETMDGFLNATVQNQGTIQEVASVTALYNNTIFGRATVIISPGGESFVQFDWNTTGVTPGAYVMTANVTILAGEKDIADNTASTGPVQVFLTRSHDVAVVSVSPTGLSTVVIGSNVTAQINVRNNGPFNETFQARLFLGQNLLKTWTNVEIRTLTAIILTFTWNTAGTATGGYLLKANVTLPGDVDGSNNELLGVTLNFFQNRPPSSVFTLSPGDQVATGEEAQFNATGSFDTDGRIVTYTWDFGDGSASMNGRIVAHVYNSPGNYTVRLTVTDEFGMSNTSDKIVKVSGTSQPPANQPDSTLPIMVAILGLLGIAGGTILLLARRGFRSRPKS